jgi:hypothetical protein
MMTKSDRGLATAPAKRPGRWEGGAEMGEARRNGFVELPEQTHSGTLKFPGVELECAVLEGGRRIVTAEGMKPLVGDRQARRDRREGRTVTGATFSLPESVKPFTSNDLTRTVTPIAFRRKRADGSEVVLFGYDASIIPDICDAYLNARDAGKLNPALNHIADRCYRVVRALARVGIVALVAALLAPAAILDDEDPGGISASWAMG